MFQKPSADLSLSLDEEQADNAPEVLDTVVGPSVHVEGDFASEGNILVKGKVTGDVKTSRSLTVEAGATVTANVQAENSLVSGEITGNMKVKDRLELTESARVIGDIICSVLVVHAGALVLGKVSMNGLEPAKKSSPKKRFGRVKTKSTKMPAEKTETPKEIENE